MNRRIWGLTRADVLVIIAIAVVLALLVGLLLPMFARPRESARNASCRNNLNHVGKALEAYCSENNGCFPFSWGPGDSAPKSFNNAAASSLGLLYAQYIDTLKPFRCPSTENEPAVVTSPGWPNPTWALADISYGHDPRMSPNRSDKIAVMADMDGSYLTAGSDTPTQNHFSGQNVLYADGHVKWVESPGGNFVSDNPKDNIFAQDPWDADTDTYLVSGDLNDLTISFDGYDHLK